MDVGCCTSSLRGDRARLAGDEVEDLLVLDEEPRCRRSHRKLVIANAASTVIRRVIRATTTLLEPDSFELLGTTSGSLAGLVVPSAWACEEESRTLEEEVIQAKVECVDACV